MLKTIILLVIAISLGIALGTAVSGRVRGNPPSTLDHYATGPTLEQIRRLASLVTLHVPISDVQVSKVSGYTGATSLVLIVKGDVEIGTDLRGARFEDIDRKAKRVTVVLPSPTIDRPRLNHDRTRIYRIDRDGLWRILPGQASEKELINSALQRAQRLLIDAARQASLIDESRRLTEDVLRSVFETFEWRVEIRWSGDGQLDAAAGQSASKQPCPPSRSLGCSLSSCHNHVTEDPKENRS